VLTTIGFTALAHLFISVNWCPPLLELELEEPELEEPELEPVSVDAAVVAVVVACFAVVKVVLVSSVVVVFGTSFVVAASTVAASVEATAAVEEDDVPGGLQLRRRWILRDTGCLSVNSIGCAMRSAMPRWFIMWPWMLLVWASVARVMTKRVETKGAKTIGR
jgi:hypothetical protein